MNEPLNSLLQEYTYKYVHNSVYFGADNVLFYIYFGETLKYLPKVIHAVSNKCGVLCGHIVVTPSQQT